MLLLGATAAPAQGKDSLTIDDAIATALRNSHALRGAEQALAASQARTREVHSAYLPQVEADASYRRMDPTVSVQLPLDGALQTFSFVPNDNYEAAITAQQVIYDFGKTAAAEDLARAGEASALDNQDQVRAMIAYQTVQAFNTALLLQQHITVLDEQIAALGESLSLSQQKLKEGTVTEYDVLTTQVRLTTVENQRVDVSSNLRKQDAALRRLLGIAGTAPLALKGSFTRTATSPAVDSLTTIALQQRSELALARDAAGTAKLQMDVAGASDSPLLALSISGGVKNGYPPDLNAPKLNWVGGIRFALPIFNGFRTRAMEEEAQANFNAAQERVADLEQNVRMEVEQALADRESSAQRIATADIQVRQANAALALARTRYKFGVITSLELLNAQTLLQEAEFARLQSQYNYTMSQYSLERAMGQKIW
ncbi:MAG: outer rane efflux protein [Chlorobi bacterium]|nr:outer rane efflux protein [Chlorobiota bacterium]